jgi:MYXO-CTERM domain-containing protein
VTLGAYGSTPTSAPFVAAVAGVVLLSVGGLVMARRRRA